MALHPVPSAYFHLLATLEPFLAGSNALMALLNPVEYLDTADPNVTYSRASHQILLDQLAGTYTFLALVSLVVLRRSRDLRVWRDIAWCMLACDALHLFGTCRALGWEVMSDPLGRWRGKEWMVVIISVGMVIVRLGLLCGFGFKKGAKLS